MELLPKIIFNQDVFFILLTISFFLIALLKGFYWKHAKLLFLGVIAQRHANQFLREENAFSERVNIITFLLMIINFTLLISYVLNINSLASMFKVLFWIIIFFIVKVFIIKSLGFIFRTKDLAKLAIFFSLLFDRTLAFLLFPLIVVLYFFLFDVSSTILIAIFAISIILLFFKFFRIWLIGTNLFGLSQIYIFLYLCTLEILPLLMLGKVVFY